MNLVRLGHYFTPSHSKGESVVGSCQTALVTYIWNRGSPDSELVNLAVWTGDASQESHTSVPVTVPSDSYDSASFHLSGECPWKR